MKHFPFSRIAVLILFSGLTLFVFTIINQEKERPQSISTDVQESIPSLTGSQTGLATPPSASSRLQFKPFKSPKRTANRTQLAASANSNAPAQDERLAQQLLDRFQELKAMPKTSSPRGMARGKGQRVPHPGQQKAIDDLLVKLGEGAELQVDGLSRTLRHLRGDLKRLAADSEIYREARARRDFAGMSLALAQELQPVMNVNDPQAEFTPERVRQDELGMTHVLLQQQYHDVPIWGAQVSVHYNAQDDPVQVSGVYAPSPVNLPKPQNAYDEEAALRAARAAVGASGPGLAPATVRPTIYWDIDRAPVMTHQVTLTPDWHKHWLVFVSMTDGSVVHRSQAICSANAVGHAADLNGVQQEIDVWQEGSTYYAVDTETPMYDPTSQPPDPNKTRGAILVMDANDQILKNGIQLTVPSSTNKDTWDPTVVSVLSNLTLVENYYRSTFSRNSIDDNGMSIFGIVNIRFSDSSGNVSSDNAFWNPGVQMMIFGSGSQHFQRLPSSLDVTGHELTHGVINHSANLIYENQSGALNESLADFFGAMVDRDEWLLGDGVTVGTTALRDMQDPHNPAISSQQPKTMEEFEYLPNTPQGDQGGVHINSGIPNHVAYLLAEGPQGVGKDVTEKIIYRALLNYLTQRSQFIDYRRALISAASDLYGDGGAEVDAVRSAFDAVGITDASGGQPQDGSEPTPGQPTTGDDLVLFLNADVNAGPDASHNNDFFYVLAANDGQQNLLFAPRYVANTRPAISGDGEVAVYVGVDNNLYWIQNNVEHIWNDSGKIRTIACTKDMKRVAYTTTDFDNLIYIFNTETFEIQTASTTVTQTDGTQLDLDFADILSFNFRGDRLIYDAALSTQLGGERYEVWGIYELRLADLNSQQLVPQAPGEQIGNPMYANTLGNLLIADHLMSKGSQTEFSTVTLDLFAGKSGLLRGPFTMDDPSGFELFLNLSTPSFQGNDQGMVYKVFDAQAFYLVKGDLTEDKSNLVADSEALLFSSAGPIFYPLGFRVGEYIQYEGSLSTPASLAFNETPVLSADQQTLTVRNDGNGDLELLDIQIEGADSDSFSHSGTNRVIPAGEEALFNVSFSPQKVGNVSALLRIKSSVLDQEDATVQLNGVGVAALPTPTPGPVSVEAWRMH